MAEYTFATLDQWVFKVEGRLDMIVKQSVNDMLGEIPIRPGTSRGGRRVRGMIPRMDGFLADSLQSSLYGSTSLSSTGADSYVLVAAGMKGGDVAEFLWGNELTPYARAQHYGHGNLKGTFWVDVAANKWPDYVARAIEEAKARLP